MIRKSNSITIIKYIFLSVLSIITVLIPLWILFINSAKPLSEAVLLDFNLPSQWKLIENYSEIIKEGTFLRSFLNTFVIASVSVSVMIILGALASWVFARSKSKISTILYYISIAGILVPPAIITTLRIFSFLHLKGTIHGMIIFYIAYLSATVIFFTTGFVKTVPKELEEAAMIDGCGTLRMFFSIVFPMLRASITKTTILIVLIIWTDFMHPLYILGGSEKRLTMVTGLLSIATEHIYQMNWHLVFSGVILTSLPLLIFYIFMQRRIVSGIISGSVKG